MNSLVMSTLKSVEFNQYHFVESYDKNVFSIKTKSTILIDNMRCKINCRQNFDVNLGDYSIISIKMKQQKVKLLVKTQDAMQILGEEMSSKEWMSNFRQLSKTTLDAGNSVSQCIHLWNTQARQLAQQKQHMQNKLLQAKVSVKADDFVQQFRQKNWNLENEMEQCGLQPEAIQLIKDNGAAACDITEFLSDLAATLPKETTVIGLNHKQIIHGVSTTLQYEDYLDAYQRIFNDFRANPKFLEKLKAENHPIVFLVPHKLFGSKRGVTANEMEWFLTHAEKMENVFFVFRAYKVYSKKNLPSISNKEEMEAYTEHLTTRIFQQIQANCLLPALNDTLEDETKLNALKMKIEIFEMYRPQPFQKPVRPPIRLSSSRAIVAIKDQNYPIVVKSTIGLKTLKQTRAIFLMGATGSGKGAVSALLAQKHPERKYMMIDPDLIKESMPQYQEAVANKDKHAASYVHDESVKKATHLLISSIEQKKNFIYDSTGSRTWIYEEQMQAARKNGMFVELIYVETRIANCFLRAQKRGVETGRFVPEEKITASHQLAQDFFPDLRAHAHQWKKYNNDGSKLRLVESYKAT